MQWVLGCSRSVHVAQVRCHYGARHRWPLAVLRFISRRRSTLLLTPLAACLVKQRGAHSSVLPCIQQRMA